VALIVAALRGGTAFLTRLPVGGDERAWEAFRATPVVFPLVGYVVGALAGLPLALPVPVPTAVALYLATLYLVTGVTHADGLADAGDAAAVHGRDVGAERRREAMRDSSTGVGGALLLGLVLVGLALGALGLAGAPAAVAVAVAVAAEVGAKTGMAALVCAGTPAHEGLGSALAGRAAVADLLPVAVAVLPLLVVAPALGTAAVAAALLAGPAAAALVGRWAAARLGGVSGDVLGAANELGRVAGVHAGVVAWTYF
jgi:adenosylcobinamide-GDP ribazoletransferase